MRPSRLRPTMAMTATVACVVALLGAAAPATAKVPGPNGRIVFSRWDFAVGDFVTYVANPDGTAQRRLLAGASEEPHWSPDGRLVAVLASCTDGSDRCAATVVDPVTGSTHQLPMTDPGLFTACPVWAPDGGRLACEGDGVDDPSRSGIYTIRASDGGGLTRVTSIPGGFDSPGDYSPDGRRLVFTRNAADGTVTLDTVTLSSGAVRRLAPGLVDPLPGAWSPDGTRIVFAARTDADHRRALWTIRPDGSDLRALPVQPACGGDLADRTSRGCLDPAWSPDGTEIVLSVLDGATGKASIFTVNADGTGLLQVTRHGTGPGDGDKAPDWGPAI